MTGIERLRELVDGISPITALCGVTKTSYDMSHIETVGARLRDFLADIADQIERELDEEAKSSLADYLRVRGVERDMERHVSGVEGMEDSPVARWARELREALDGRDDEEVTDVATVRADAMEAWRWVHEHGGIEVLHRLFQDADSRRVELCAALGIDLDNGWSEAMAAMRLRIMPAGVEWPRYEDGEPVRFGDSFLDHRGNVRSVLRIDLWQEGGFALHTGQGTEDWHSAGERVKRPQVPATDGEPEPPDSWERLKSDIYKEIEMQPTLRTTKFGIELFVSNVVRRCRALAERGE